MEAEAKTLPWQKESKLQETPPESEEQVCSLQCSSKQCNSLQSPCQMGRSLGWKKTFPRLSCGWDAYFTINKIKIFAKAASCYLNILCALIQFRTKTFHWNKQRGVTWTLSSSFLPSIS